ncbi:MAG: PIN domain-containing protein [Acidobacteriota bacterium]
MILVDTSVLIGFLRGHRTPAIDLFEQLERESIPFSIPYVCLQEVLQGARDLREWRLLEEYFRGLDLVSSNDHGVTHLEAARIYFDCRRKGITLRSTIDCLIAQLAIENQATLLHDDGDFDEICKVRPLQALRA